MPEADNCRFCSALSTVIDRRKVWRSDGGKSMLDGQRIELVEDRHLDSLIEQAEFIRKSELYEMFVSSVRSEAVNIGIKASSNFDQTLIAKAMIYNSDIIDSIINSLYNERKRRNALRKK